MFQLRDATRSYGKMADTKGCSLTSIFQLPLRRSWCWSHHSQLSQCRANVNCLRASYSFFISAFLQFLTPLDSNLSGKVFPPIKVLKKQTKDWKPRDGAAKLLSLFNFKKQKKMVGSKSLLEILIKMWSKKSFIGKGLWHKVLRRRKIIKLCFL